MNSATTPPPPKDDVSVSPQSAATVVLPPLCTNLTNNSSGPRAKLPTHPSFRRQRANKACQTCHVRKIRCDAATLGVPCTSCAAFDVECRIATPLRRNKNPRPEASAGVADIEGVNKPNYENAPSPNTLRLDPAMTSIVSHALHTDNDPREGIGTVLAAQDIRHEDTFVRVMRPKFVRTPITKAGRVAYLGESSPLSLLVQDSHNSADAVHYSLPEKSVGSRARMEELDHVEIDILHQRGAFLPPRHLCDEIVEAFFTWIAPVIPVINRSRFMRQYYDSKRPPSILLLQAVLLAGSRVCKNPQLLDPSGSSRPSAMTFYKRAKALIDANYEDDRVTIVQALVLMGWYWEGPEDVTMNAFFWSRLAITVAQGSGMHRSVENSQLSKTDKRLWKRIWWTLFTRDRSVAVALGRPCFINPDDFDVEMVSEEDFVDDDIVGPDKCTPDPVHTLFFLHYVKLTVIMGQVLSQHYPASSQFAKAPGAFDLTASDMALADWLQDCPADFHWERTRHSYWTALLQLNFNTTLCLLHQAHMPPGKKSPSTDRNGAVVPESCHTRNIAYTAAGRVTAIIQSLRAHDQIRYTPAFIVYSLFSALIMHVHQLRSSSVAIVKATEAQVQICMNALKDVAKVWSIAQLVLSLFETILGSKVLAERLHHSAGTKYFSNKRSRNETMTADSEGNGGNRKHGGTEGSWPDGGAAGSTTSHTPPWPSSLPASSAREVPAECLHQGAIHSREAPGIRLHPEDHNHKYGFISRPQDGTRAGTPMHLRGHSSSEKEQELFLPTNHLPDFPEMLWNIFQPDQLFSGISQGRYPNQQVLSNTTVALSTMPGAFDTTGMSEEEANKIIWQSRDERGLRRSVAQATLEAHVGQSAPNMYDEAVGVELADSFPSLQESLLPSQSTEPW